MHHVASIEGIVRILVNVEAFALMATESFITASTVNFQPVGNPVLLLEKK
jgi:hypothetical protein